MRAFSIYGLTLLGVVIHLSEPAEAGRRGRRRAAAAVGIAAVATRRPVVAGAAAVAKPRRVTMAPDLTITEMSAEGDVHCVTVKNIGQVASPATRLRVDFHSMPDGALIARKELGVLSLLPNQSVRFRLHALPSGHVQVIAQVDPHNRVAETNELNNDLRTDIVTRPPVAPAPLDDVEVWVVPNVQDVEGEGAPTNNARQE